MEINIRPVDKSELKKLQKVITSSKHLTEFAKKTLIWMLAKSEKLTKQISLSFSPEHDELGREVAYGIHDACSSDGSNKINDLLKSLGTPLFFSSHGGIYVDDKFNARVQGFTVWIAVEYYSNEAEKLLLDLGEIIAMRLH